MIRLALAALFLFGCSTKNQPSSASSSSPSGLPPIDLGGAKIELLTDASAPPTFAILNTPEGPLRATPAEAVAYLTKHCDGGDHAAVNCYSLARSYANGLFVEKNLARAIELFQRACDKGEPRGCSELGVMYDAGEGLAADAARAKKLFRQACDAGSGLGCNNLFLLHPGKATKEELKYVLGRLRAICDLPDGDGETCATLGSLHMQGQFVKQDDASAAGFFEKACGRDHAMGCNNLGACYALGRGVAKDPARAATLYQKACTLGSPQGCVNAGK